jgi:hypothetical protein
MFLIPSFDVLCVHYHRHILCRVGVFTYGKNVQNAQKKQSDYIKINLSVENAIGYPLPGNVLPVAISIQWHQIHLYILLVVTNTTNHFNTFVQNVINTSSASINIKIPPTENKNGSPLPGIAHDVNTFGCNTPSF